MRIVFTIIGILLFTTRPTLAFAENTTKQPDPRLVAAEARKITQAYADLNWLNGTVLVSHNGKTLMHKSWGLANRKERIHNSKETLFNLGSIMKNFTKTLVLMEIQNGNLSINDTLDKFNLGFADEIARKITIQHLLEHRSGFSSAYPAAYRDNPLAYDTINKRLSLLVDAKLMFEPGSSRRYSNYGYIVLGAILEKLSGQSFADLIQSRIFSPLNMKHARYPYMKASDNQSLRYTFTYKGEQKFIGVTEHHAPDGGIEATALDTAKFYKALFTPGKLLDHGNPVIAEQLKLNRDRWQAYGGGEGVSAAVEIDHTNNYQVVVLSNSDNLVAELISMRIMDFVRKGTYDPILLPPHVFAWNAYQKMGPETFKASFRTYFKEAGYNQFIGRVLNNLGLALVTDGAKKEALDIFETLRLTFPEAPQVYDSLAYYWYQIGNIEKARESFRKAREKSPSFNSDYRTDNFGIEKTD